MIKRILDAPISTTAFRRTLQAVAIVITICCAVTILLMARAGYSLSAALLAATPFVLVKVALMILIKFSR